MNTENSKCNNNYQNSLINEILKNNKTLKKFTDCNKNNINNVNNIKRNIENIFSNDESRLKAIKYIIKTRKDKRESAPNYKNYNKDIYPTENNSRGSSPEKGVSTRLNYEFDIKTNNSHNNKVGNYTKRHILQISSDNILIDDEENSNHVYNSSKDSNREKE